MGKCGGQTAFDVYASSRVLDKEIRSWNVVSDDPTDLYGIAPSRLLRTELPDLIRVSQEGKGPRRRLCPAGQTQRKDHKKSLKPNQRNRVYLTSASGSSNWRR